MTDLKNLLVKAMTVVAVFSGSWPTVCAETVTEGFDDFSKGYDSDWSVLLTLPEGWDYDGNAQNFSKDDDAFKTAKPAIQVEGTNTDCYLITPELEGDFSFYLRNRTKNYQASAAVYACTYIDGVLTLGSEIGSKTLARTVSGTPTWEQVAFTSATGTRVALLLSNAVFDDFTYTPYEATAEPTLSVVGTASGSTYDFGTVAAGTTKTFTLWNGGLSDLSISNIAVTGDFTITAGADLTGIAAKGTAELTIATPAKDAEGVLTITSNDANSPYTVSMRSTYKVPMPVMGIDLQAVEFGVVSADASQDITVSNTGDAVLTAQIASDSEDFTVSPESLTVAAGDSRSFTITYHYSAEAYGGHAATITVTPNAGEAITISATASVKDPNAWSEDFSGNTLPQGWTVVGSGWTFANGEACATYERTGYLVTPKLKVQKGQTLTFQARSTQFGTDIIVQYQKDDGEWIEKMKEPRNTQTEFETYAISGLEDGIYRFRIATENLCLDNFEGFQLASGNVVQEKWWVSYAFHYMDVNGNEEVDQDAEPLDVIFDGDNVSFNFPNPITGNAWMAGTKSQAEGPTCYVFSNGQYIGKYSGEDAYYCGSNGSELTDMVFYYSEEELAFRNFEHILINSSTNTVSYWGYFSDVVVSKEEVITDGVEAVTGKVEFESSAVYDMQGRKVACGMRPTDNGSLHRGLYIVNGKKYLIR